MAGDVRVQKANKVLDAEIAALREQVALAKRRRPRQSGANDAVSGQVSTVISPPDAAAPAEEAIAADQGDIEQRKAVELVTIRVNRLEQIKGWITTDGDLLPLIAKVAGDVEGRFLRRNLAVNVALSTIFLIAGWLLSIVATPTNLGHIFTH
jgi:hypothetical protein